MRNSKMLAKRQDNVFIDASIGSLEELTGLNCISSKKQVVISEGEIVNVVSDNYGFLPNERFFLAVEEKLIMSDIPFEVRSINNKNRSFKVDYILNDDYATTIGSENDKIVPLMSFVNSYDGSNKTSGSFGLYRQVCSNGLMVADTEVGFSYKHTGNQIAIVMPEIDKLIETFTKTEYFELQNKFKVMANKKISDIEAFVQRVCESTKLFSFETTGKEPEMTAKAKQVVSIISREMSTLSVEPNMWLGYNAFNEIIHAGNVANFGKTNDKDSKVFETILRMA